MKVKLAWVDRNVASEGTRIYRSETKFDKDTLPVPLATVGPSIYEYTDETAVKGKYYYYAFESFQGSVSVLSKLHPVLVVNDTGHGPQELLSGDLDKGYFGTVLQSDFITHSALMTALGLSGTISNDNAVAEFWIKYAYRGKVCFTPRYVVANGINWNTLYAAGCVYGTNDNGPLTVASPVNQNKMISIDGKTYRVRLPRIADEYLIPGVTSSLAPYGGELSVHEFWDIHPNLTNQFYTTQRGTKLANSGLEHTYMNNKHTQQSATENEALAIRSSYDGKLQTVAKTTNANFAPVLELVPTY